jgi:DNA-binding response OmpR family regulator
MRLVVVDSDRDIIEIVTGWLRTHGHEVFQAFTIERARQLWREKSPDVVIFNPGDNDHESIALAREMRDIHGALVLVFASSSGGVIVSAALEEWANNLLAKPFVPQQLLAHLKAWSGRVRSTLALNPSTTITVGPLLVDSARNVVTYERKTIELTPTESRLLHVLAANANDNCTLELIVSHVWGMVQPGDTRLVKAHIRHLREKIEPVPNKPRFIITTGVGYMLKRHAVEEALVQRVTGYVQSAALPARKPSPRPAGHIIPKFVS